MPEPKIDQIWDNDREFPFRKVLVAGVATLLIVLAFILCLFKGCNQLGAVADNDIYPPKHTQNGSVKQADQLLEVLVADTVPNIKVTNLEELNKKYRALIFDLPYASYDASTVEGNDLRLVGIRNDRIPESFKPFYYNSRLPQLLQQQSDNLAATYFRIRVRPKGRGMRNSLEVDHVRMIPSLSKVALVKNPWTGTIYANSNCLFDDAVVYLSFGNTIIPFPKCKHADMTNPYVLYAKRDELCVGNNASNTRPFNNYKFYRDVYTKNRSLSIRLVEGSSKDVNICCQDDMLIINSKFDFSHGRKQEHAGMKDTKISIVDGDVLTFYDDNGRKLSEFNVNVNNPSRILSTPRRTSVGRDRHVISRSQTDLFTQQLLRGLSRSLTNTDGVGDVTVTLDPLLSKEFEEELKDYLGKIKVASPQNQIDEEYDISMTVMDIATGNVLATPFYTTRFDKSKNDLDLQLTTKNVALTRRYLGSTFKPMLALAALLARPNLLNMSTIGHISLSDKNTATFLGRKVTAWAKDSPWHWRGTNFVDFLAHSDDVYPVALASLALSRNPNENYLPVDANSVFDIQDGFLHFRKNAVRTQEPFWYWLSWLYDANFESDESSDLHLYDELFPHDGKDNTETGSLNLLEITPDITNLHYDLFDKGGDFRGLFVPWVLGQGSNEWNCVKIAEAWSRMIGKRKVRAHFIKQSKTHKGNPNPDTLTRVPSTNTKTVLGNKREYVKINETWNGFLDKFSDAQTPVHASSTLSPMYDAVAKLNQNVDEPLVLFSKTGTPDGYVRNEAPLLTARKRFLDIGMFTFALVKKSALDAIKNEELGRGIVCVIRITRSYTCKKCAINKQCKACKGYSGLGSSHARSFFAKDYARLEKFYHLTKSYY